MKTAAIVASKDLFVVVPWIVIMGVLTLLFTNATTSEVIGAGSAGAIAGWGMSFTLTYFRERRHERECLKLEEVNDEKVL